MTVTFCFLKINDLDIISKNPQEFIYCFSFSDKTRYTNNYLIVGVLTTESFHSQPSTLFKCFMRLRSRIYRRIILQTFSCWDTK